jgi:hypothetical protein
MPESGNVKVAIGTLGCVIFMQSGVPIITQPLPQGDSFLMVSFSIFDEDF